MIALTPEERTTLEARLLEAQTAYHDLMLGRQARVIVDQNGERVEFSPATSSRLSAYISELRRMLGQGGVSGPMMVLF